MISQVSAGRKNRLWFEVSGTEAGVVFDQEQPETLWVGRRSSAERIPRDLETLAPEAAAYVTLLGGHPQGYADCFDAFVGETYVAIAGEPPADGRPSSRTGGEPTRSPRRCSSSPGGATGSRCRTKLGLLSACRSARPRRSRRGPASTASRRWSSPRGRAGDRLFVARHVAADEFDEAEAERAYALYDNGLELSALAYYDNNLHPDLEQRGRFTTTCAPASTRQRRSGGPGRHLQGRDNSLSVAENLREAERVFRRSSTTPASAG